MGRDAGFRPVKVTKTNKKGQKKESWKVEVPATYSKTGKRHQRSFPTRDKAEQFAKPLRDSKKQLGQQRLTLAPEDSDDAAKALILLKEYNVSLSDAARFYVRYHDERAKAPTVAEAWQAALNHRKGLSSRYLMELRQWERKLTPELKARNLADLQPLEISQFLDATTNGLTAWRNGRRYLSAVFGDQVKKRAIKENPCHGVIVPKVKSSDEVVIYKIFQVEALFRACKLYPQSLDRDCRACAIPFAFLAFAGIRPTELTRLTWDDVKTAKGFIRLSGLVTKTGATRNVPITGTLAAWIDLLPPEKRAGRIIPSRWLKKAARVKAEAGLDGLHLQDALRHSYGSFSLAMDHNEDAVIAAMGHRDRTVFRKHYHNAIEKSVAETYWAMTPQTLGITAQDLAA